LGGTIATAGPGRGRCARLRQVQPEPVTVFLASTRSVRTGGTVPRSARP